MRRGDDPEHGKGGRYRHCCGSRKLKEFVASCHGVRMPMDRFDDVVIGEAAKRVLRLIGLKVRRDELANEAADLQRHVAAAEPQLTPEKIERLTRLLHDKLLADPAKLRPAHHRQSRCCGKGNPYQRLEGRLGDARVGGRHSRRACGSLFCSGMAPLHIAISNHVPRTEPGIPARAW